jgi:hypothetical protein
MKTKILAIAASLALAASVVVSSNTSAGPSPAIALDNVQQPQVTVTGSATETAPIPCLGTGTDGPRVQAIYLVPADRPNRYATIAPQIATWAGQVENAVEKSALKTGGQRQVRFATNRDCSLNVANVTVSATGDDSLLNTMNELKAQGYGRTDRMYLIWGDALVYCGIGYVGGNDSPLPTNPANTGPGYGRVDTGCWNRTDHSSALHELIHTLGAVQRSAPHATLGFHCTDESDAICYADDVGVVTTQVCPTSEEWLLDCGDDDYFNTNPPAGSYLATHWNVANSVFLHNPLATIVKSRGKGRIK